MAPLLIYVADEHWNAGLGHRMRFEALREALAERGVEAVRTESGQPLQLNERGNIWGRDDLRYALIRKCFRDARPTTERTDPLSVSVTCYPSTTALEMICMGYRVALLAPRNDGERFLSLQLAALSDQERFFVVDGLGAQRVAEELCGTS